MVWTKEPSDIKRITATWCPHLVRAGPLVSLFKVLAHPDVLEDSLAGVPIVAVPLQSLGCVLSHRPMCLWYWVLPANSSSYCFSFLWPYHEYIFSLNSHGIAQLDYVC